MHNTENTVTAVDAAALLVPLPPKPPWLDKELAQVATIGDKPAFRIVDGQRELQWRNGKMDIKHLLQHDTIPAYVRVARQVYRRINTKTGEAKYYTSEAEARKDDTKDLSPDVDWTTVVSTRGVGKSCWIVEAYVRPEEIGEEDWNAARYREVPKMGKLEKVDVLGPFPREGRYIYCFSVLDEDGNAVAPSQQTIDECKKRWYEFNNETNRDIDYQIATHHEREKKFEKNMVARLADNVYQYNGIAARRLHGGVVSKPITKVYE